MAPRRYLAPRTVTMTTKVSDPEASLLDELARKLDVTRSSLVHRALREFLERNAGVPAHADILGEDVPRSASG